MVAFTNSVNSHVMGRFVRYVRLGERTIPSDGRAETQRENQTMKKFQEFSDCVIGVDSNGVTVLVEGPPKLYRVMGGPYLEESCLREGFESIRGRPGLYRATIACRWVRGSLARVLAGDNPAVELTARDVRQKSFESLSYDRCDAVFGLPREHGGSMAQLSRVLRRLRTRLHAGMAL
jgi:hypothetical protein